MTPDDLAEIVRRHAELPRPAFSAARILVLADGIPVVDLAHGVEARYADREGLVPVDGAPVTADTRFDLASITKLFTAAIMLETLADAGLDLETPVADVLAEYRAPDRAGIRFRHLLTHTAGLPPVWSGWQDDPTPEEARERVLALPPVTPPDAAHAYSCIGYIHAGIAAERIAGRPLDELLQDRITGPLGLTATGYRPAAGLPIAATEWQARPDPGITRGVVHDETARALGGVSGNAGIFATAQDLGRFGEELRSGAAGVLRERTRELMSTPLAPLGLNPDYEQAAGPRLGGRHNFGVLADGALGHSGFTGTLLLVHPERRLTVVALTNRVHPNRDWTDIVPFRQELAAAIGGAA